MRRKTFYLLGLFAMTFSLWISFNAIRQTRLVYPGETLSQALRNLLLGRPVTGQAVCTEAVHDRHATPGPDGRSYPTWHPPVDLESNCYFDHEHGSDPHSYVGYPGSGLPAFGYTSGIAGITEPHAGYKVYITNNDLNGRAWMIVLNQDTASAQRLTEQFHTLDWHISSLNGEVLVNVHVMADFGYPAANCGDSPRITAIGYLPGEGYGQKRVMPTVDCAAQNPYEAWDGYVNVGGVFEAAPTFDVDNPATVVDPSDPANPQPTCRFRPTDESCATTVNHWNGNRRGVLHPGQYVHNAGPADFSTDAYGRPVSAGGVRQFVTTQGWDTRNCCGPEVVFRIQTFSRGLYLPNPRERPGSAEFTFGPP